MLALVQDSVLALALVQESVLALVPVQDSVLALVPVQDSAQAQAEAVAVEVEVAQLAPSKPQAAQSRSYPRRQTLAHPSHQR